MKSTCYLRGNISPNPACHLLSSLAYSSILKIEATCSSETSIEFQRIARRYTPEDGILQLSIAITSDSARTERNSYVAAKCLLLEPGLGCQWNSFKQMKRAVFRDSHMPLLLSFVPCALVMSLCKWSEHHCIPQLTGLGARTDQRPNSRKLGYQAHFKGFPRWFIPHRITGFLEFFRRPVFFGVEKRRFANDVSEKSCFYSQEHRTMEKVPKTEAVLGYQVFSC
jgi:hypothetical protein